jgi:hypothetical protein
VFAGLPYALGTTAIIFGKHIDKLGPTKRKHPHPPGTDSRAVCRYSVLGIRVLQYVLVYLVLTGFFTPTMLVVLFSLYLSSRLSCRSFLQGYRAGLPRYQACRHARRVPR